MLKRLIHITLMLSGFIVAGQNIELDSMKTVLDGINDDTARVNILIEMADECRYNFPEEVKLYSDQALQLAQSSNYSLGEGLASKGLGKYHYDIGEYDSAMYYYKRAELIFRGMDDKKELSNVMANYCYVCVAQGEYNKALEAGLASLQLASEIDDQEELQHASAFLGFTYHSAGNKDKALKYLSNGVEIAKERGDIEGTANILRDIAIVYDDDANYREAIMYYGQSAELFKQLNDQRSLSIALFNMAEAHRCQGEFNEAINGFYDSYQIASDINDHTGKTLLLLKLARTYIVMMQKGYELQKADQIIIKLGYSNINDLLESTSSVFEKSNNKNELINSYLLLVNLNKLSNNPKKNYLYNSKLIELKEELSRLNAANTLAEMLNRFEMQQMEKELELLAAQSHANAEQIALQRQVQLIIIVATILLVIIGFMLRNRIRTIRKTKEEIQNKNKQLEDEKERAEKSEMFKEKFLTNVSHEIRTPMNAIMGITNLLIKNKHLSEQKKYLEAISISARHLLGLINDILDLSKLESGKFEFEEKIFRIDDVFEHIHAEMSPIALEKGLEFAFHPDDKIPAHLIGDQYMLQQILLNLCRNAFEYTKKGRVDVSSKLNGATEKIAILGFTVKDTGIGIDKELHDKLFNSFIGEVSFDKKSFNQTGLELVIMRQMVELQGGSISVDSKPGVGTTFYFEIPYQISLDKDDLSKKTKVEPVVKENVSGLSILLVEDNEFNVMVAKEELEDAIDGVWVDVARNGQVAVDKVMQQEYDLILMDIQMPVMNGYDATITIRKMDSNKKYIPIIAMTANIMKSEVDKCFEAGMNAYIPKPFDRNELIQRIQENLKF